MPQHAPSALASLLALLTVALTASRIPAEDWPQWRGPRGDGTWNAPKLPERWPAGGLKCVWRQPLGGGYAGIALAAGRVYVLDRERLPGDKAKDQDGPDGHERVLCFAAADGQPLWSHRYPTRYGGLGGYDNGPRAMPTVHDGRVYTLGAVGHFFCFEAATGKILWQKDMVREHRARVPEWGFAAAPVIDGDRVIVHTGAEPDGCLIAFDRVRGTEIWRSLSDPAGYCTPILIDAPGGRQLVAWTPDNVRGLDPRTGRLLWTVPYKVTYGVSIATPIFREGIVFVTGYWEGAKALRLGPAATDAALLWENRRQLCGLMAQPLYRDGCAYSIDKAAGLVCFELRTGKKLWDDGNRLTPAGRNPHASIVWLNDGDRVLALNAAGELVLARLNRDRYQEQSRTRILNGNVWAHPAFAGKHIYARSDGGEKSAGAGPYELVCVALTD
jgi:outer membrane protein assembly factor BamB